MTGESVLPPRVEVTLAVLTGGASRRMGRDKASLWVGGRVLAARPVEALGPLAGEVLAVGRPIPGVAARLVEDERPGQGPLAGVVAALRAAHTPLVLVAACDMPSIAPALGRLLLARAAATAAGAIACEGAEGPHPFPAVYRTACRAALDAALDAGARSVRQGLAAAGAALVGRAEWAAVDPAGASFTSWNRPEDLPAGDG